MLILLAAGMLLPFQNCSQPTTFDNASSEIPAKQAPGGSGSGYDGKLYYDWLLSGTCADGSVVRAAIDLKSTGDAYLIRDACADLPQPQAVTVTPGADPTKIAYNGISFVIAKPDQGYTFSASAASASVAKGGSIQLTGIVTSPVALTNATIQINATDANGAYPFSWDTPGFDFAPGETKSLTVTYTPAAGDLTGEYHINITVYANGFTQVYSSAVDLGRFTVTP